MLGYTAAEIVNRLSGLSSYLTKPIKVTEFMEALDVALDFSQTASGRTARKEQA